MRKFILCFVILLAATLAFGQAGAQPFPIKQAWSRAGVSSSGWGATPTIGDPFIACWSTQGSFSGISDSQGTSFTQIDTVSSGSPTTVTTCWKSQFTSTAADTVTVTGSFSNTQMLLMEFDKNIVTSTVDGHANGSYSSTPATVTTTTTTSFYNSVYVGFIVGVTNTNFSVQAPMILTHVLGNQNNSASGYYMAGNPGAKTGVFNNGNASGNWVAFALKPVAMAIYTTSVPTAVQGTAYRYQLSLLNGVAAPTWTITSGNLPAGLTLNSSTGVISGTPTGVTRTFTVQANDGTTQVTQSLTLTVNTTAGTPTYVNSVGLSGGHISVGAASTGDVILVTYIEDVTNGSFGHTPIPPTDACSSVYYYLGASRQTTVNAFTITWVATVPSGGTCTITPNGSDTFVGGLAMVLHNVQSFFDTAVFTTGAASTTWTSNSITTLATNSMIYTSAGQSVTTGTFTAGAGYTLGGGYPAACTSTCSIQQEYGVQATEGAYTPAFTAPNTAWEMVTAALRPGTTVAATVTAYHRSKEY